MRLAAITDIHGNYVALEAVLRALDDLNPDGVIFLGDYVTDCPCPERTLALLREVKARRRCWFVRGNREEAQLHHAAHPDDGWRASSATGSMLYTYERLTKDDLEWFSQMPVCMEVELDGLAPITICHGSPASTKEWIKGDDEAIDRYTRGLRGELLLCGHTHGAQIEIMNGKTVVFCPSAGMPHRHENDARLTLLEHRQGVWRIEFMPVPCDLTKLYPEFEKSGLSQMGGVYIACVLRELPLMRPVVMAGVRMAARLAREDGFSGKGAIPEKYWLKVLDHLDEL